MATKLEELADQYRVDNIIKNHYQNGDGKEYGATHKNAISDGDSKGKGAGDGSNSDSLNTSNAGSIEDIETRNELIAKNEGKYDATIGPNGFGPSKPYYPDYIIDNE